MGSRDPVWSAVLRCLAESKTPVKSSDVEVYLTEEVDDPPALRTVHRTMNAMKMLGWLERPYPNSRKWQPGPKARRYLKLSGGAAPTGTEVDDMTIGELVGQLNEGFEDEFIDEADDEDGEASDAAVDRDGEAVDDLDEQLADLDLPGDGDVLERRREAVRECYELLQEQGKLSKSDALEKVYPDHPAGYESPGGWWNTIGKVGLRDLARVRSDVVAPSEGGRTWEAKNPTCAV